MLQLHYGIAIYIILKVVRDPKHNIASKCCLGSVKTKWEPRMLGSAIVN